MLHDIVSGHHFARSISHVTGTSPASVPDASDAGKGAAVVLHLRSAAPPSCTDLSRLQRASAPGDLRLEIACVLLPPTLQCVCVRATWPSLLAPRLDFSVLLPHVWQRCTPAHRTGFGLVLVHGLNLLDLLLQCAQSPLLVRMPLAAHSSGARNPRRPVIGDPSGVP